MVSSKKNLNEVYWKLAQKNISGGTMLYSKDQTCIFPKGGQHIFQKQKGVNYGILITNLTLIHA